MQLALKLKENALIADAICERMDVGRDDRSADVMELPNFYNLAKIFKVLKSFPHITMIKLIQRHDLISFLVSKILI